MVKDAGSTPAPCFVLFKLNPIRKNTKKIPFTPLTRAGTGKTYLSAFDVRNFSPKKMLFLVHREQILKQAKESFKDVLGESINAGILSGNYKDYDADYLFSTIQTMSKEDMMHRYNKEYFDYIVIDETHKAGAESYRRIMDYFQPKFMMGMTAYPERADGFDIYEYLTK